MILEFDDGFKESLNYLISGLLPHERYDNLLMSDIYNGITRYVKPEEMPLEYRVLMNIIYDVRKAVISISKQGFIKISRDLVDTTLSSTLEDFILEHGSIFKPWFEMRGLDSNINIRTNFEQAVRTVYEEVMNLYDDCYSKEVASEDALAYLVGFKNEFSRSAALSSFKAQMEILNGSIYHNKKSYKGPSGWTKYMADVMLEVTKRTDDSSYAEDSVLDSEEKGIRLLNSARQSFIPLANYGIPPIDNFIPMVTNRFSVIVAREGVGKTLMSVYLTNNLLNNNKKVLYMTGETSEDNIFVQVLSNYILKNTGNHISVYQITNPKECTEDINTLVTIQSMKLSSSGNLILKSTPYCYDTVDEEMESDYTAYGFDAIYIDHSLSLKTGKLFRTNKERVDHLAEVCRTFKRSHPVQVTVLSHFSANALDELARTGKIVNYSPTRESSALSYEADDVFILFSNEQLEKQHIRAFMCTKRRGASKADIGTNYLKIDFTSGEFMYDPKIQDQGINGVEASAAIKNIEEAYDSDLDEGEFML